MREKRNQKKRWTRGLFARLMVFGVALILIITIGTTAVTVLADQGSSGGAEPENKVMFIHRSAPGNIAANSTYLDYPMINDNPDAILVVTQNVNPGGGGKVFNNHPIGVWYDANVKRWAVFNQDFAVMPDGVAFNVAVQGELTQVGSAEDTEPVQDEPAQKAEQTPIGPGPGEQVPIGPGPGEQSPIGPGPGEQAPIGPAPGEQAPIGPGPGEQMPPS